jgi:prevent-host-death family protein
MNEVGLREMRQSASELVRRAQAGERVTITVAGRPTAMLGPVEARAWRQWDDIAGIYAQPADGEWAHDRDLVDHTVDDPWRER